MALTVPLLDGSLYLGDVPVTVLADQSDAEAPADRILALLEPVLEPVAFGLLRERLAGKSRVRPGDVAAAGMRLRYASDKVALVAEIPLSIRAHRPLAVASGSELGGAFEQPARVSAYLSARGTLHMADDFGTRGLVFLDGAARVGNVVLESDAVWQAGARADSFERRGTRAVFDDPARALRFTVGDLVPASRGFQAVPGLAGVSVVRSFGTLQPYRTVRPSGRRSFLLERNSIVEVFVNDQLLRRLELEPGTYDLRDFAFAQGANNLRLAIRDGSGRTEELRFDTFIDQSQLAAGLDEFGVFVGVLAPPGPRGLRYSDDPAASAYYRRGISDALTLGANLQADAIGQMAGAQAVFTNPLGTWRADAAVSSDKFLGAGAAAAVTFARTFDANEGASSVLSLSLETATRDFRPIGPQRQARPFAWQLDAQYVHGFSSTLSGGLSARLAEGWGEDERLRSYRANLDWQVAPRLRFTAEAHYDDWGSASGEDVGIRLGLRYRIGQASVAALDYDTRLQSARLSYSRAAGQGVGSYSLLAEAEHSRDGAGLNADATYIGNRAEFGFSRFTNLEGTANSITTVRLGSAIAFADGALAIGPPVRDSFAIVTRHRSLASAEIRVDESDAGYAASTGRLGAALRADLGSYVQRTLTIHSPDAPATANLGSGAFRLLPPYHSGYRLQVGSDYQLSVVGRLLDPLGRPLALLAGVAREDRANGAVVEIFTNQEGRFGATGLRPGRWWLDFDGDAPLKYLVEIGSAEAAVIALGTLSPQGEAR